MGQLVDGRYVVTDEERARFHRDGFVHLEGLLTAEEVDELEVVYDRFLRREIDVPGKDYCDMAGDYGRAPEDYSIINVMLPRRYFPAWQGNVLEQRSLQVAAQLHGDGRILVRASGTEPLIRVMVEAATPALAQSVADELAAAARSRWG